MFNNYPSTELSINLFCCASVLAQPLTNHSSQSSMDFQIINQLRKDSQSVLINVLHSFAKKPQDEKLQKCKDEKLKQFVQFLQLMDVAGQIPTLFIFECILRTIRQLIYLCQVLHLYILLPCLICT